MVVSISLHRKLNIRLKLHLRKAHGVPLTDTDPIEVKFC
jgi:hypothetical protein